MVTSPATDLRNATIIGAGIAVVVPYAVAADIYGNRGRFTTDFLAQFAAQIYRNGGDVKAAFENVDAANAFFKAALGGNKKLVVVEEMLKSIFDVTVGDGAKAANLEDANAVLAEFGLRMVFKNKAPQGGGTPFSTDVIVKTVRGEINEEIQDELKNK